MTYEKDELSAAEGRFRFGLKSLFLLPLIAALILGWMIDRNGLKTQIESNLKTVRVYTLLNFDAEQMCSALTSAYDDKISIVMDARTNSIIVSANETTHNQIQSLLPIIDRLDEPELAVVALNSTNRFGRPGAFESAETGIKPGN